MRQFILGGVVGGVLMASMSVLGKDSLGRSPQQQKYDYFRERQQQLDVEHMRKQMDQHEFDRKLGKKPC
jgi:gas vesicle protein